MLDRRPCAQCRAREPFAHFLDAVNLPVGDVLKLVRNLDVSWTLTGLAADADRCSGLAGVLRLLNTVEFLEDHKQAARKLGPLFGTRSFAVPATPAWALLCSVSCAKWRTLLKHAALHFHESQSARS